MHPYQNFTSTNLATQITLFYDYKKVPARSPFGNTSYNAVRLAVDILAENGLLMDGQSQYVWHNHNTMKGQ